VSKVVIYRFRGFDIIRGESIVSPRWGTLEAIKAARGEAILRTATEVDASAVDTDEPGMTARGYEPPGT
jgi:hypothetical protein